MAPPVGAQLLRDQQSRTRTPPSLAVEAGHQLQDLTFNITCTSMDPKLINEALDACTATGITNAVALRVDSRLTVFGRESHATRAWHCAGAPEHARVYSLRAWKEKPEVRPLLKCERLTAGPATYSVTIVLSLRLKSKSACGLFWGW